MSNQIVISSGAKVRNLSGVLTGTSGIVNSLGINVPDGIPQLDGSGKILVSQLPNSVMEYKGTWNAATNTPTLANGTGNAGDVYLCNVAGTTNFGAGGITFAVGDQVLYSGTTWEKASGATGTVTSVAVTESGDALSITGSPITTSGTINIGFAGTIGQYINGAGGLTTFPSLTGFVPYTGATGAVNLGAYDLTVNELTIGKGTSALSNNTALGHQALFHISTGNYNTGVGHEALHNTSTGQYNTALGQSALFTNTSGSQNTALGLNALLYNTSGGSNVVVGLDAMQHNTTGSSNTALGYNAGSHITGGSTPNTTASNSVYIGRDTKAKVDGGANEIVIGYNAIGNGSNTATFGNSSITANYFTGSINGGSFVKSGGTSSQFLKADGSVDSNTYLTTSNASSTYVPYTGATTNVNIGNNLFTSSNIRVDGDNTSNFGYLGFKQFSGGSSGLNGYTSIFALNTNTLGFSYSQGAGVVKNAHFNCDLISSNTTRVYSLPNADGTIALTSNLSSYLPLSGGTLTGALSGTSATFSSSLIVGSTPILYGNVAIKSNSATSYFGLNVIANGNNNFIAVNHTGTAGVIETEYSTGGGYTPLQFVTGGTTRLTIASSGVATFSNVINANSDLVLTNAAYVYSSAGGSGVRAGILYNGTSQELKFFTADLGRMVITSSGNVGIGTSSPSYKLDIRNDVAASTSLDPISLGLYNGNDGGSAIYFRNSVGGQSKISFGVDAPGSGTDDTYLAFSTGGNTSLSERMRITSGGDVLINKSSLSAASVGVEFERNSSSRMTVDGGTVLLLNRLSSDGTIVDFRRSTSQVGTISVTTSATSYNTSSDYRLKQDLKDFNGLNLVSAIKTYDYEWKADQSRAFGVLAHELAEVIPYAVNGEKDGEQMQGVDYSKIVPILVKAIQEQQAQIEELKALILNK